MFLLDQTVTLVSSIMKYVLIGTCALGAIFLLVIIIMIAKRAKYQSQMNKNKKQKQKILRDMKNNSEKGLWNLFLFCLSKCLIFSLLLKFFWLY